MLFDIFKKRRKYLKLQVLHERIEDVKNTLQAFELVEATPEQLAPVVQEVYDECQLLMEELEHAQEVNDKEIKNSEELLRNGWWATAEMNRKDYAVYLKRKAYFDEAQKILSSASEGLIGRGAKKKDEKPQETPTENQPSNE